jgi:hypothetical protein
MHFLSAVDMRHVLTGYARIALLRSVRSASACPFQRFIPHVGPKADAFAPADRVQPRSSIIVGITQVALEHEQSFLKDEQRHMALRNLVASFATQLVQR